MSDFWRAFSISFRAVMSNGLITSTRASGTDTCAICARGVIVP